MFVYATSAKNETSLKEIFENSYLSFHLNTFVGWYINIKLSSAWLINFQLFADVRGASGGHRKSLWLYKGHRTGHQLYNAVFLLQEEEQINIC